jgi:hypothetical protein
MPRLPEARRARERRAVAGKVRYGGFAKATSNHRGPDDRGTENPSRGAQEVNGVVPLSFLAQKRLQLHFFGNLERRI